jgi:N-acetylneuraminic acid mutarotase
MRHVHALAVLGLFALGGCSDGEQKVQGGAGTSGGSAGTVAAGGSPAAGTGNSAGTATSAGGSAGQNSGGAGMSSGGGAGTSAAGVGGVGGSGAGGSDGGSAGTTGAAGMGGTAGDAGAATGGAGASSGGSSGSAGTGGSGGNPLMGMPTEDTLAPLSTVRQEHGVGALNGEVYVLGGYAPQATDSVRAYDPTTMMWRDVADFPGPFNHPNVGTANGKLYVLGFYVGGDMNTANAQSYAFDGTDWEEVKPLPTNTQRAAACVASLGNDIYVFGGHHMSKSVAFSAVYHAMSDTWTELPDLPVAREHCVAGAINGKLYIVGGRTDTITGILGTTLEFDPQNPGYVEKKPMMTPRGGIAGAVLGGKLFVFGGEGNPDLASGVFPDIESYDPSTDEWEAYPPMKVPRHGMGAAEVGGRIYIPAGADRQGGAQADDFSVFYFK